MSTLSDEKKTELIAQGRDLSVCATIDTDGIRPIIIENVMCFMAKNPLIKVGLPPGTLAERRGLASSLASSTDSTIIKVEGQSFLMYRTPKFGV